MISLSERGRVKPLIAGNPPGARKTKGRVFREEGGEQPEKEGRDLRIEM